MVNRGRRKFITGVSVLLAGGSILAPLLLHTAGQRDDLQSGAFREKVMDILHRSHPNLKPGLPDDPALIEFDSKTVFLGNLYAYVHDMETEGQEIEIAKFLETTLQPSTPTSSWKEAVDELRIQIVPIEYRKVQLANKGALITRDFTPRVLIAYALDNAQSYKLVTPEMLKQWNVSTEVLHEAAVASLEKVSTQVPIHVEHSPTTGNYAIVSTCDGYDAARILLPEFRERLRERLSDKVFLAIPNRDFLVAWTPDFAGHAGFVAKVKEDSQTREHPLTDELFVLTKEGIRLATPIEIAGQSL